MKQGTADRTIDDPRAVELLTNERALPYLAPFLGVEQSLSSAAAELGVAPSSLAHWVSRFVAADVVTVTSRERRAGMASPRYVAPARLVVPGAAIPPELAYRFIEKTRGAAERQFVEALGLHMTTARPWALEFARHDETGGISTTMVPLGGDPSRLPPALDLFQAVALRREDARALVSDLRALLESYQGRSQRGTLYLVHLGVARHHG